MLKSVYHDWLNKVEKIIPINIQGKLFLIGFLIIITTFFINILETRKLNKEFFNLKLVNKIDNITFNKSGYHYKINKNWYIVKHPIVNYLSVGDSIIKDSNSLYVKIKNKNEIKWDSEVRRNIIFFQVYQDMGN
jgi:hypothetical protein